MGLTVAILGVGFMAATHAPGFTALGERVRVTTVCGRSDRGRKSPRSLGAEFVTELDGVLDDPEIDLVDVCLPTPLHREVAERALDRGKHVLLEKPIALTVEDGEAIVAAAKRSGKQLMVGMVLRFFAEYVEIQRRIESGELGRPLAASAYRLSFPADWNTWMRDPRRSGGTPVDLMVHDFDQLNWLLCAPRRVYARASGGVTGHVTAAVDYDGAEGLVEGSMVMPASYPFSAGIRVVCESGVLEHTFRAAPAEDGGNIGGDLQSSLWLYPDEGRPEELTVEGGDPWAAEIAYFVECVERERPVERGTGRQAVDALRVSLAASRSIASGSPEEVS